jgi:hypothetical protein
MITPSFGLTATERVLPRLALDWTTGVAQPGVDVTRAGVATYIDSAGAVQSAAPNTQRIDWSKGTPGLLIEESRTNILLYSEDLQNAFYNGLNLTIGSPDVNGFFPITETATTSVHSFRTFGTDLDPTKEYAIQLIVKPGLRQYARLSRYGFTGLAVSREVGFDFVNKTVIAGANSGGGTIDEIAPGIFRITANPKVGGAVNDYRKFVLRLGGTSETNLSYAGDDTQVAMWIKSPQAEESTFATSYIPTEASQVTRNADVATMPGTNFSDFWQAGKGGVLVRALHSTVSGIRPLVQYDDGTADNLIALRGNAANPELQIVDGGTPQAQIDAGTIAANTPYSLTGWWQENNSFAQLNTQASVRDNTVTIPTVTQARIGSDGTNYLNGTIAAIYYYDELANSIYDSLRLLGYTGTVTDMLLQYYLARGATSNSLTDAEIEFLGVKGFTTGTIDDRWTNYLISLGYSGTITDMKYQYWKSPE